MAALRYLKRERDLHGRVDEINMRHVDAALDRVDAEMTAAGNAGLCGLAKPSTRSRAARINAECAATREAITQAAE